jgi:hypothetical protein
MSEALIIAQRRRHYWFWEPWTTGAYGRYAEAKYHYWDAHVMHILDLASR